MSPTPSPTAPSTGAPKPTDHPKPLSPSEIDQLRGYIGQLKDYISKNKGVFGNGPAQIASPSFTGLGFGGTAASLTYTAFKVDESGITIFGKKWPSKPELDPAKIRADLETLKLTKADTSALNALKGQIRLLAQAGSGLVGVAEKDATYNGGKNNQATLKDTRAQMQHLEDAMKALATAIG